jgi:hypothetical protein
VPLLRVSELDTLDTRLNNNPLDQENLSDDNATPIVWNGLLSALRTYLLPLPDWTALISLPPHDT